MKKLILFTLIIINTSIFYAQSLKTKNHNINIAIKTLKNDKYFKNASIGFYVKDINSGEVISSLNAVLSLAPASTQKLITTAAALEILGSNYRFKTRLEYTGKIDKQTGILEGNLIIKGGGDPTLGSKYFSQTEINKLYENWAKAVSDADRKSVV